MNKPRIEVVCQPNRIKAPVRSACVKLLKSGGAVNAEIAAEELKQAFAVAVVYDSESVVGIGSIKRARPYTKRVAERSGASLPKDCLELGYIAVSESHKGRGISKDIVTELLAVKTGPLFATTDNPRMISVLKANRFVKTGKEWKGKRGVLSLWIRS